MACTWNPLRIAGHKGYFD